MAGRTAGSADLDWLRRVAAAMPPEGHGLPVDGRGRPRLRSPEGLIRELWDAIADTLVRTPAAVHATGPRAFAAAEPVRVDELADWLAETDRGLDAGAQVQLRVELPAERDPPFAAVVQVRGVADPSLVVDAGELWNAPAAVLARLGERAETDLLLALRRGARAWPPLAPLLRSAAPTEVSLDEEQVAELLETGAEALGGAGIEVLWPAELLGERLSVRATVATPAPAGAAQPAFRLQALLSFDWTTPGLLGPLERFRRSVAVPVERYRDADATERAGQCGAAVPAAAPQERPAHRPGAAGQDGDRPAGAAHRRAGDAVRGGGARDAGQDRGQRGNRAARAGAGAAHRAQADLQPSGAVPARARALAGRSGKLAALDELLEVIVDEGEAARVFSQYVEMCGLIRSHLADRGVPTLFLHGRVPAAAARSWSPSSRMARRRCSCSRSRPAGLA